MRSTAFVVAVGLLAMVPASASFVSTTSSATFESMVTITQTEDFHTLADGQDISSGSTIDGLTYSAFVLLHGDKQLDITNQYVSFSGLSLGVDHTKFGSEFTYFLNGEGATITFASPVTAFGMFFNVQLNSGTYGFSSSVGSVTNNSSSHDGSTGFIFAGIISTTPFSSITFIDSTGSLASYTVPELLIGSDTPEPSTLVITMAGIALLALGAVKRRYF
jgi:hypothetical protein